MLKSIRKIILSLFASQIALLEGKLEIAEIQIEFFQGQAKEERAARFKAEKKFDDELERNRTREDLYHAQSLANAGVNSLPSRFEPDNQEETDTKILSEQEESLLRQRARDYCQAASSIVTNQEIENTFELMKKNPEKWLSN